MSNKDENKPKDISVAEDVVLNDDDKATSKQEATESEENTTEDPTLDVKLKSKEDDEQKDNSNKKPSPPPKDNKGDKESQETEQQQQPIKTAGLGPAMEYEEEEAPPPPPPKDKASGQKFVLSETKTEVYVTQSPASSGANSRKLIILLTNSLGLSSTNNLLLADLYSKQLGVPVIVPDMFDKDPIPTQGATLEEEDSDATLLDQIKLRAAGYVKGFLDEMWLAKHTFERTYPHLASTVAEIVDVYKPTSMAVIGYSFGGKYVLHLLEDGKNNEWSSDEDLVSCGVSIHPSLLKQDDFEPVAKPLYLVTSDQPDDLLPDSLIQQGVSKLQEKHVEFDRVTFGEGLSEPLPHGFAVPNDYPEQLVHDIPQQVINVVASWVQEHL